MKIERIDVHWVRMPLVETWTTSYGDQFAIDTILVRMEGEGQYAWGESCPVSVPGYSSESVVAVFYTICEHFAPRIIGQDIESAQDVLDKLEHLKGNQWPRAAMEITWWVLDAKRKGVPLHKLLGGTRSKVKVGADFGVQDTYDILLAKIQGAVDAGFPRIKLKFRPGWDLNMLDAVRSAFPNFTFHVDCNAAFTLDDADLLRKIDRYHLAMIEQPLRDDAMSLLNHAELQKMIETPICLDESIQSINHAEMAIRLGSGKVVNIKMARVGGLTASRTIQALCAEHDIPCWVGGMLESALGGGICAELATLPNFTYPGDVFPSSVFYARDLCAPEMILSGPGEVTASQVPGVPYEPVPELLKAWTVQHAVFRA